MANEIITQMPVALVRSDQAAGIGMAGDHLAFIHVESLPGSQFIHVGYIEDKANV